MQVASSTWMAVFTRLENNTIFREQVERDGNYYQVTAAHTLNICFNSYLHSMEM
jgi:hypothetical protein